MGLLRARPGNDSHSLYLPRNGQNSVTGPLTQDYGGRQGGGRGRQTSCAPGRSDGKGNAQPYVCQVCPEPFWCSSNRQYWKQYPPLLLALAHGLATTKLKHKSLVVETPKSKGSLETKGTSPKKVEEQQSSGHHCPGAILKSLWALEGPQLGSRANFWIGPCCCLWKELWLLSVTLSSALSRTPIFIFLGPI